VSAVRTTELDESTAQGAEEPAAVEVDGPVRLFDGVSLDGLYTWLHGSGYQDPDGVFRVRDGVLRVSGARHGYIGTRRSYRNYRVVLEYRWGERNHGDRVGRARDSGLFLHAVGPDGNSVDGDGAFRAALEIQIMEGAVGDFLLIRGKDGSGERLPRSIEVEVASTPDADGWPTFRPGGSPTELRDWGRVNASYKDPRWVDSFGFRGENDVSSPPGTWSRIEVDCRGQAVEVRVDGTVVNRARAVDPSEGPILIQSEGSELEIRRWELLPLSDLGAALE
jgi:hypothetical protein